MKYKFFGWACLLILLFAIIEAYGWIFGPHFDERAWHYKAIQAAVVFLAIGAAGFLIALAIYFFTL